MPGPLDGVRVLDLTRLVSGGLFGMLLADAGAEVAKVEAPGRGDTLRAWSPAWWKVYGRGKKSLTLDLGRPAGREALRALAAKADLLAENFFAGKLESWGLGPGALLAINPRLVILRISGWGQEGPYRDRPGFGTMVEGMSGFASMNGFPDSPPLLPPFPLADMTAALYGVAAAMFALYHRDARGGGGQVIDLALHEPLFSILGPLAADFLLHGKKRARTGNRSLTSAPRNLYPARDGRWIALAASTQPMAERLFRAIGREDLIADPRFADNAARVAHAGELDAILAGEIARRTCAENLARFEAGGVTASPVYDIEDVLADPHFQARELVRHVPDPDYGAVPMQGAFPRMSGTPLGIRWTGPALGAHTGEVLSSWLGWDAERVEALRREGAI
ncbi:MAG: CoA transferase [Candidatus Tectomicrobia bacterium]|uniref:CoA transferase n=1 Tax=Tectimicrobiota bacterium TaxID=2528274 RepID=A0A932HYI8_UNCTE|nr:CoA transferase [Candidatus Tectomicrobia bacterium]